MLKPIGDRLRRRAATLVHARDTRDIVTATLQQFLQAEIPSAGISAIEVSYDEQRSHLTLVARTKALASELLLRSPEIARIFRTQGLKTTRIVIR